MPLSAYPTDRLVDRVKKNIGRQGDTSLDDYVLEWINLVQKDVCKRRNFWFMRRTDTSLSLAAGDGTKALPTNYKDEDGIYIKKSTDTEWTELEYMDETDLRTQFPASDSAGTRGRPTHYTVDADDNIIIRPFADAAYSVLIDYFAFLTDNTSGSSGLHSILVDDYSDLLEFGATARAFSSYTEWGNAGEWEPRYEKKIQDLMIEDADRVLPNEFVLRFRPDVRGSGIRRVSNR